MLLLTLILLKLPGRGSAQAKLTLGGLFLPLFGLEASVGEATTSLAGALIPRKDLAAQNDTLRRQNQALRLQVMQAEQAQRENDRLRQLLGYQQRAPWPLKIARVIGRDPANWSRSLHLNLGRRDGVKLDQPVLTDEGLVGRIAEVSETRSRVVLLGDPNCRVPVYVRVDDRNGDQGVITGSSGVIDTSMADLGHLSRSDRLRPGQWVYTSGLSQVFPPGIPVGQLVDLRPVEFGLYVEARVKLAVNFGALDDVFVLLK